MAANLPHRPRRGAPFRRRGLEDLGPLGDDRSVWNGQADADRNLTVRAPVALFATVAAEFRPGLAHQSVSQRVSGRVRRGFDPPPPDERTEGPRRSFGHAEGRT